MRNLIGLLGLAFASLFSPQLSSQQIPGPPYPPSAQVDQNYTLEIVGGSVFENSTAQFDTALRSALPNVVGWQWSICFDTSLLAPVGLIQSSFESDMNNGTGPWFWAVNILPEGVTIGTIFALPPTSILAGDYEMESVIVDVLAPPASVVSVEWCSLKNPGSAFPIWCEALLDTGFPAFPLLADDTVSVVAGFSRGDSDGDGIVNIADPVGVLGWLFPIGLPQPGCLDAADVNDDGAVNIADPVWVLNYLFASGPPPAPPFSFCGSDPTQDSLDCADPNC